jgi:hypothetical protein
VLRQEQSGNPALLSIPSQGRDLIFASDFPLQVVAVARSDAAAGKKIAHKIGWNQIGWKGSKKFGLRKKKKKTVWTGTH